MRRKNSEAKAFTVLFTISKDIPLTVECPLCNAPVGERCSRTSYIRRDQNKSIDPKRILNTPHHERYALGIGLNDNGWAYSIDHDAMIAKSPATYEEAERRSVLWAERAMKLKDK